VKREPNVAFHLQWFYIGDSYAEVGSSTDGRNCNVSVGNVVKRRRYSPTLYVYCLFCCYLPLTWITVVVCSSLRYSSVHRRNLANKICEWGRRTKSNIGVRNFHLGRSEHGKRLKFSLNQSFIYVHTYIHPFPQFSSNFYYFAVCNLVVKKIYSYVEKMLGEDLPSCPPPSHTIYVYVWAYRHMCFQCVYVYILICLLYEISALEIVVTWDNNLIEPNIFSFFD